MKTEKNVFLSVDEYICSFPENTQKKLTELRNIIRKMAPEATEKISYQMPAYSFNGVLIYFAGYAKHVGFYPGKATIEAFNSELINFKTLKGTVQFQLNQPLPENLIKQLVLFRISEKQK